MIFTPASTRRSATAWAASAGTARTPTTISSSATTALELAEVAHLQLADLGCRRRSGRRRRWRRSGSRGRRRSSELAIAWPRLPAPKRAMLCWPEVRRILRISDDQRVDVVADAALAELAEAGEVAADLGRVDVGVLGELLRGDRLPAHLARLGQHLQVAREARRDAQREPLAVDRSARRPRRAPRSTSTMPPQYRAWRAARRASRISSETTDAVDLDHRDPLEVGAAAAARRSRCRPRAARSGSPRRAGRRSASIASSQRWQPGRE